MRDALHHESEQQQQENRRDSHTQQTPASPLEAVTLPRSPTNRRLRRRAVLNMQRTFGNHAVVRRLGHQVQPPPPPSIQRQDPVSVAGLGVSIFSAGQTIESGGMFTCQSNTPSYMHENTPAEAEWEPVSTTIMVVAQHPRVGIGNQYFYFNLSYERNGYDIRNAVVNKLEDRSSTMVASSFTINWGGQAHSRPTEEVSEIVFNISNSTWDPVGLGSFSFHGQLIISASKSAATYSHFHITGEDNMVYASNLVFVE